MNESEDPNDFSDSDEDHDDHSDEDADDLGNSHGEGGASLEEDIALNETMLESLQKRMVALDNDIETEGNKLLKHESDILALQGREASSRKTRDVNTALLRDVTLTLDKCIQRLRKRLDEKAMKAALGVQVHAVAEDLPAIHEEIIDANQVELHVHVPDENEVVAEEESSDAVCSIPPPSRVPVLTLADEEYMEKRWSQSCPSDKPIFQHSAKVACPIFPLHAPFTSVELLSQVINVSQKEVLARRRGMDGLELETDYIRSVRGTVLDIAACTQYDPYLLDANRGRDRGDPLNASLTNSTDSSATAQPSVELELDEKDGSDDPTLRIDANTIICRKALFGKCEDPSCSYQHLSGRANVKSRKSNKLRTVDMESSKNGFAIMLPIHSHPFPPPPTSAILVPVGLLDDETLKRKTPDIELRVNDKEESPESKRCKIVSENELDTSDVACLVAAIKVEEIPEETSAAETEVITEVMTETEVITEVVNKGQDKDHARDGDFGIEDDFILLPTIDDDTGEAQISATIKMVLSDCDDDDDDDEELEKIPHIDPDGSSQSSRPLSAALSVIGFDLEYLESSAANNDPSCELSYRSHEPSHADGGSNFSLLIQETNLLCSMVKGVQLCIHSGRVDVCNAILKCGEMIIQPLQLSRSNAAFESHQSFLRQVIDNLMWVVEGSTNGRGSFSSNCTFHIQLLLTHLSHFTSFYRQMIVDFTRCNDVEYGDGELEQFRKTIDGFRQQFMRFEKLLFHENTDASQESNQPKSVPFSILVSEIYTMEPVTAETSSLVCCKKLLDSLSLGQKIAKKVTESLYHFETPNDPQLLVENELFQLVDRMKTYSFKCKRIITGESINSNATQLAAFQIFGPAIFTCVSGIIELMGSDNDGTGQAHTKSFSAREVGILMEVKQLLMQSIQLLDFSGAIHNNVEGQLLLCPFFGLLSQFLVTCEASYTKAHVLLVNALYSAHTKMNWSIYSDLLWSQLIQLHMIFPLPTTSLPKLSNDLAQLPLRYGVHTSKITLEGDSALVNCVNLSSAEKANGTQLGKHNVKDIVSRNLKQIRSVCLNISALHSQTSSTENVSDQCEVKRQHVVNRQPINKFPLSVCLIGCNLSSLTFNYYDLDSLPVTFGFCFPLLKVRSLIIHATHCIHIILVLCSFVSHFILF